VILDSSAVVAVIREETDEARLLEAIEQADRVAIGTPTLVETSIVLIRRMGVVGQLALGRFLERNGIASISFEERHWNAAAQAFIRFGKGRHPAALNYGDCMTYAIAHLADDLLLFTGNDFAQTDIPAALG
jgi:ribonuclease VapC